MATLKAEYEREREQARVAPRIVGRVQ